MAKVHGARHDGKITPMDSMSKAKLRERLLSKRPHSSLGLAERLSELAESLRPKTLASFQPLGKEPQIQEFNSAIETSLRLVFPRVSGDSLVFAGGELVTGQLGMSEPTGEAVAEVDLILLPALAVDLLGNRLGRGRGFYDRALSDFPRIPKFAVVFDEEVLQELPTDPWDEKVNGVVTPKRIIKFD